MSKYVTFERCGAVSVNIKAYLRSPEYQRKRQELKELLKRQRNALRLPSSAAGDAK